MAMIVFAYEGRRIVEARLPGRYKGKRRRREGPIQAECPCGAKSRPMSVKRAEEWYQRHLAEAHSGADLRNL
jgi:hypothetical protein